MKCSTALLGWAAISAAALMPLGATAQAPVILKDTEITEKALVEALTPEPVSPAGTELVRRSIRVVRDDPAKGAALDQLMRPARVPQASILITFETNSATLTPGARAAVDVVARALQAPELATFRFLIEGHADPRGSDELNLRLSQARAASVVSYLVGQHAISRERLDPVGKGDRELMNTSRLDAPENRRVTIVTIRE